MSRVYLGAFHHRRKGTGTLSPWLGCCGEEYRHNSHSTLLFMGNTTFHLLKSLVWFDSRIITGLSENNLEGFIVFSNTVFGYEVRKSEGGSISFNDVLRFGWMMIPYLEQ